LLLREDNADLRLTQKGFELGCVDQMRWDVFRNKRDRIEKEQARLKSLWLQADSVAAKQFADKYGTTLEREYSVLDLLRRPETQYLELMQLENVGPGETFADVAEQVEIQAKYAGYIQRQEKEIEKHRRYESAVIPDNFDYKKVTSLSAEVLQKLEAVRPKTVGQASRISGVTPAAISLLLVYLKAGAVV